MKPLRSDCPINYALEIFGDQWSLLIIRDMVFGGKNTYSEFLQSPEGISTNILASRLTKLCNLGLLSKRTDPDDARTIVYKLTKKGCALVPMLHELMLWGIDQGKPNRELKAWAKDVRTNKKRAMDKTLKALSSPSR